MPGVDVYGYDKFKTSWGSIVDVRGYAFVRERTDGFTLSLQGSTDGEHWVTLDSTDVHEKKWSDAFKTTTGREPCGGREGKVKFVRGGPWHFGDDIWELWRDGEVLSGRISASGRSPWEVCDGGLVYYGTRSKFSCDLHELELRAPKPYTGPCPEGMWEERKPFPCARCGARPMNLVSHEDGKNYCPEHLPLKPGDRVRVDGREDWCKKCNGKRGLLKSSILDIDGDLRVLIDDACCTEEHVVPCAWPACLCEKIDEERTCGTCEHCTKTSQQAPCCSCAGEEYRCWRRAGEG